MINSRTPAAVSVSFRAQNSRAFFVAPTLKPKGFSITEMGFGSALCQRVCRALVSLLSRRLSRWFCLKISGLGRLSRCLASHLTHTCTCACACESSATARQRDNSSSSFLFSIYFKWIEGNKTVALLSRCCLADRECQKPIKYWGFIHG